MCFQKTNGLNRRLGGVSYSCRGSNRFRTSSNRGQHLIPERARLCLLRNFWYRTKHLLDTMVHRRRVGQNGNLPGSGCCSSSSFGNGSCRRVSTLGTGLPPLRHMRTADFTGKGSKCFYIGQVKLNRSGFPHYLNRCAPIMGTFFYRCRGSNSFSGFLV